MSVPLHATQLRLDFTWSEETPSHPNSGIKTLEPTLQKAASP